MKKRVHLAPHRGALLVDKYQLAWWMQPEGLLLGVLIPALILVGFLGPSGARGLDIVNHISWTAIGGLSCLVVVMAASAFAGRRASIPYLRAPVLTDSALTFAAALTLLGYTVWFAPLVLHPGIAIRIFTGYLGAVYQAREELNRVPGLTTLTESGIAYVIAYGLRVRDGRRIIKRRFTWYLYAIFGLGVIRVFVNSERLALIELVIPYLIIIAPMWASKSALRRRLLNFVPPLAVALLVLLFAGTEYFRSWVNHYSNTGESLLEFSAHRLIQYYTLSINTGFTALDKFGAFGHMPYFSLEWLYKFPFIGTSVENYMGVVSPTQRVLQLYGDEEFNNFSGLVGYIWDFGWIGATVFLAGVGFVVGCAARGLKARKGWLSCGYPLLFMALVSIIRIPYLTGSRMFVAVLTLFAMLLISLVTANRHRAIFELTEAHADVAGNT